MAHPVVDPSAPPKPTTKGGLHQEEKKKEGRDYVRREFRYGSFVREFSLPSGVSESDVKATYRTASSRSAYRYGRPRQPLRSPSPSPDDPARPVRRASIFRSWRLVSERKCKGVALVDGWDSTRSLVTTRHL